MPRHDDGQTMIITSENKPDKRKKSGNENESERFYSDCAIGLLSCLLVNHNLINVIFRAARLYIQQQLIGEMRIVKMVSITKRHVLK